MMVDKSQKVFVAMSGGVDSSVAAALLKKRDFDIVGIFFKPWAPPTTNYQLLTTNSCLWEQDRQDAMRVCAKLDIPFKTWDFSKEYEKEVVKYMVNSYRAGITPNPDVMCNKEIKFGLFLKEALAEGADFIATGHYARRREIKNQKSKIKNTNQNPKSKKPLTTHHSLLTGLDPNKDQSYFLWTLTQEQLKYCLFPVWNYTKPEVRKLAKKFGLPNHNKKDSQGVCFVGQLDMKEFLKNYILPKKGEIRLFTSEYDRIRMKTRPIEKNIVKTRVIGYHDGVYYYTIGQRHGLDIKDGHGPYYVARKDLKRNIIYVTNARQISNLKSQISKIEKVSWVGETPKFPLNCQVKIRYRTKSVPATIATITKNIKGENLLIKFKKPVRALTPGQSAVFYRGQEVLGGGIIASE